MKVLALNSSARAGGASKTGIMLDFLVQGLREKGAEVEVVNLYKKKINYCIGCFTCWTKTPGECIHKDDMSKEIYPKFLACDLCVMATPLYHYTVNAQMKTLIERTLPMAQPFFVKRRGVTSHPLRHTPPPLVMISVAGFPEESVFDQLKAYINFLYGDRLAAEIYRPSSEMLARPASSETMRDIYEATIQGGRELAESMKISPATLARIKQPLTSFEKMAPLGNLMWQTCIDEGVTLEEFQKRKMTPRPNSLETFLTIMSFGFRPEKAGGARLTMQYNFTGQVEGACYFSITNGEFSSGTGLVQNPDLTIDAPFEVWMDILTRKADGAEMLVQGKYKVQGNAGLLMDMGRFFGDG